MKNIIILLLLSIICYQYDPIRKYIKDQYTIFETDIVQFGQTYTMYMESYIDNIYNPIEKEYSKDILVNKTLEKEIEIINRTVIIITKYIFDQINRGRRTVVWSDTNYTLNKHLNEKLLEKLSVKFPNVTITNEFDKNRRIILEW